MQSLGSCDADQVRKLQAHLLHSFVKLLRIKSKSSKLPHREKRLIINNESESGVIFPLQLRKLQQSKKIFMVLRNLKILQAVKI